MPAVAAFKTAICPTTSPQPFNTRVFPTGTRRRVFEKTPTNMRLHSHLIQEISCNGCHNILPPLTRGTGPRTAGARLQP